jgi:acyl CoA:acetate/3-ketoacid CoA transferase beta subunit
VNYWRKDVELVLKKESSVHNFEQGSAKQRQQQRNSNKGGNDVELSTARHYSAQATTAVIRSICC